jgi:sulfopyruvate decarboxylase alpha subunit
MSEAATPADWPADIFRAFKAANIRMVSYVPDAGHAKLIRLCEADPEIRTVPLTTEEEGIGLAAGAWLGGGRAVLLMQSSGVGNCINTLSLLESCRLPFLMLVTRRGEWAEFNPWQVPMGQAAPAAAELMGMVVYPLADAASAGETVAAAARLAFDGGTPVAVFIAQRLIGAKSFTEDAK